MRNMKIPVEINKQGESTLDDIVGELERLGYSLAFETQWLNRFVYTTQGGRYSILVSDLYLEKTTTLAELRSMNIETLKGMK